MNLIPWHSKRSGDAPAREESPDPRQEFARALGRFFEDPFHAPRGLSEFFGGRAGMGDFIPALDITEDADQVVVRAELPGVDPKQVEVTVTGNTLTLSGQKEESHEDKGRGYYRSERTFGSFRRRIDLPESVDPDKVEAEYQGGVLSVRLQKKEGAAAKRIPVSTGAGRTGPSQARPAKGNQGRGS